MVTTSAEPRPQRIWWGIGLGTILQVISYGSILLGALAAIADEELESGPSFALGFTLVPIVCATVAFVSAHERASMATLKGMGIWLVVGLPLGLLNPIAGLSVGFTAAGAFTLRPTVLSPGKARFWAVILTAAYLLLLVFIVPEAAILAGALTPLLAIRAADIYSERAEAKREAAV